MTIDLTALARKAMLERNLIPDFPPEVEQEMAHISKPAESSSLLIKDLRDKLWFSIDNDETKDLDQLTYAENNHSNQIKLFVAIADVDSLVKKNSATDQFAQQNTTSVYTPTKIFPMLPEKLSNYLTSLNEKEDRLAIVVEADLASNGSLIRYTLYPAHVCNKAKLAYNSLSDWLNGHTPILPKIASIPGLEEQIKFQDQIAHQLKHYRHQQGALTLDTREPIAIVDKEKVIGIQVIEKNRARDLIEDFMIIANEATARFLHDCNFPSLHRIVRTPKRWDRIVAIAKQYGDLLPEQPNSKALDLFLIKRRLLDPSSFADLSLTIIKLLGRGEYIVEHPNDSPVGHFNLAVRYYTHSTAPNRRYIDLLNQRLLKAIFIKQPSPYTDQELEFLAQHCTQKEDDAEKVERKMKKSAAIFILSSKIGQIFDALVTGASHKGTWVRIFDPPIEGKLIEGVENVDVGDSIQVQLVHVDIDKGFIDFIKAKGKIDEQ